MIAATVLACCSGVPAKPMSMVTTCIVFSVVGCAVGLVEGACLCVRGCTSMYEISRVNLLNACVHEQARVQVCLYLCLIARALAYIKTCVLCDNKRAT